MKVVNNGGKGNPNHSDENGQFVSADDASTKNADNEELQDAGEEAKDASSSGGISDEELIDFIHTSGMFDAEEIQMFDSGSDQEKAEFLQMLRDAQSGEKDFEFHEVRTEDETIEHIGDIITDGVVEYLKKHNFQSRDKNYTIFPGASKTSHAYLNNPLLNMIANENFIPLKVVSDQEFDQLWNQAAERQYNIKNYKTVRIRRGFGTPSKMNDYVVNNQNNVLKLPAGMHGSCVYAAYDGGGTARGYGWFQMRCVLDNEVASTIYEDESIRIKNNLLSRFDDIKANLQSSLSERGWSDSDINGVSECLRKTLSNDATSGAILCGYDCVYDQSDNWAFLLSFKGCKTKKNW